MGRWKRIGCGNEKAAVGVKVTVCVMGAYAVGAMGSVGGGSVNLSSAVRNKQRKVKT